MEEERGEHIGPILTAFLTGLAFGGLLYYLRSSYLDWIAEIFLITILAFLISSFVAPLVIRGGKGLVQIPLLGHLIQPKSYAFLALFIFICVAGIVIDKLAQGIVAYVEGQFSDLIGNLIVGLVLAFLVYIDLEKEYYAR